MNANAGLTRIVPGPRARVLLTIRLALAVLFVAAVGLGSCLCALDH